MVLLAGLVPGSSTAPAATATEALKVLAGLEHLPDCPAALGPMQKLDPNPADGAVGQLTCLTGFDVVLAAEAMLEARRRGGYERLVPAVGMNKYLQLMDSRRYANLMMQHIVSHKHRRRHQHAKERKAAGPTEDANLSVPKESECHATDGDDGVCSPAADNAASDLDAVRNAGRDGLDGAAAVRKRRVLSGGDMAAVSEGSGADKIVFL